MSAKVIFGGRVSGKGTNVQRALRRPIYVTFDSHSENESSCSTPARSRTCCRLLTLSGY